jgi:uncharacterized membrane protein
MIRLRALAERLRLSLWLIPAILTGLALLAALILGAIDRELAQQPGSPSFAFGGSPEGARSVLSAIAQSMLTFTGLVFSITMLVLQLASSQLSPRVMRTFLRDRGNQIVLGLFVATFVFTLAVLGEVRTAFDGMEPFVPSISIGAAFALLLTSVGAFIWYIDHMAHAIRASSVITSIWKETTQAIDRLYPEPIGQEPDPAMTTGALDRSAPSVVLESERTGIVVGVDEDRLLGAADQDDRVLELVPTIGEFVPLGAPLARAWGTWDRSAGDDVRAAVGIEQERTVEQDPAFGFRQLVDVATRALSPGTNDPTTAVQVIDRLHDLLRRLVGRRFPSPARVVDGRIRLILPRPGWDDYLRLAVDEIRLAGEPQLQVARRLRSMLDDLASVAPADRLPPIRAELAKLDAGVQRSFASEGDRVSATAGSWTSEFRPERRRPS